MISSLVFLAGLSLSLAVDVTVIKPTKGDIDIGLVIIPGDNIRAEQYRTLAEAIQKESKLSIFVALTDGYENDTIVGSEVIEAIDLGVEKLINTGMKEDARVMVAGHSAGGDVLVELLESDLNPSVVGNILLGAVSNGTGNILENNPTLTVVGELDGVKSIVSLAPHWEKLNNDRDFEPDIIWEFPVVVPSGGNHAMYIDGDLPEEIAEEDLDAEQDDLVLKSDIAEAIDAFLTVHCPQIRDDQKLEAFRVLRDEFDAAGAFLKPITKALEMDLDQTSGSSPWAVQTQVLVSTLEEEDLLVLDVTDENVYIDLLAILEPSANVVEKRINISTISSLDSLGEEPGVDVASELSVKLIALDTIRNISQQSGLNLTFGEPISCKDMNQAVMERALELASSSARERFQGKNIAIQYNEDYEEEFFPFWLEETLQFSFTYSKVNITSPVYADAETFCCKLLTPSRAMEFIAVDSNRRS